MPKINVTAYEMPTYLYEALKKQKTPMKFLVENYIQSVPFDKNQMVFSEERKRFGAVSRVTFSIDEKYYRKLESYEDGIFTISDILQGIIKQGLNNLAGPKITKINLPAPLFYCLKQLAGHQELPLYEKLRQYFSHTPYEHTTSFLPDDPAIRWLWKSWCRKQSVQIDFDTYKDLKLAADTYNVPLVNVTTSIVCRGLLPELRDNPELFKGAYSEYFRLYGTRFRELPQNIATIFKYIVKIP